MLAGCADLVAGDAAGGNLQQSCNLQLQAISMRQRLPHQRSPVTEKRRRGNMQQVALSTASKRAKAAAAGLSNSLESAGLGGAWLENFMPPDIGLSMHHEDAQQRGRLPTCHLSAAEQPLADGLTAAAQPGSIRASITQRYTDYEKLLALTPESVGPFTGCLSSTPFLEAFSTELLATGHGAQAHAAAGSADATGMDTASGSMQQLQQLASQQAALEATVAGTSEFGPEDKRRLDALFWRAHALLKQRAQDDVRVSQGIPVGQAVNGFVDGMVGMAHMLSTMHIMLRTSAMTACSMSEDTGSAPSRALAPAPASSNATAAEQAAFVVTSGYPRLPAAATPPAELVSQQAAAALQPTTTPAPAVPAPEAPAPAVVAARASLAHSSPPATAATGPALVAALQRAVDAFEALQAHTQTIPEVPQGQLYAEWVQLAVPAAAQELVLLHCPDAMTLISLSRGAGSEGELMQSLAINTDRPALPLPSMLPARVAEVGEMLLDGSRHEEARSLLLSVSGLQEAISVLGPASVRRLLLEALQAATAPSTAGIGQTGLRHWFFQALDVFVKEWDAPACCELKKFKTAADSLQKCVLQRAQFASLLLAARKLLCKPQS